jgi:hypothetical protein
MMIKGKNMISNLSGGAFELKTGRMWTHGFSMFRDKEQFKIRWEQCGPCHGRWFFEIDGIEFSAKKISPRIEGIQQHG